MRFPPPRGTLDLLPAEGSKMRALYDRAAELARRYGYRYVETPGFEETDLFRRTSGESSDVVVKETYTFTDRGGRSLTLRPEGTAPVMRAYLNRLSEMPAWSVFFLSLRVTRPDSGCAARNPSSRKQPTSG